MVVINSATFGDEFSSTDVIKSLQDKLKDSGSIDINVDSSIIPFLDKTTGSASTKLSGDEQEEVKNLAVEVCGPSDQTCLEIKTQEFAKQKLDEKATTDVNAANIIKGRRLTVKYTDETGERTVVIPEGQKFALGEAAKPDPGFDYEAAMSPWKEVLSSFWGILGAMLMAFLMAVSIIVTWLTFSEASNKIVSVAMTAVSVFIPLSGFALSFAGGMFPEFFGITKTLSDRVNASKAKAK